MTKPPVVFFEENAEVPREVFERLGDLRPAPYLILTEGRIRLMILGLQERFTYHPPKGDQKTRYELIRATALNLAHVIDDNTPESREKSLAITKLEEVVMWANAAIARNE
jgi:hypothetical protein